MKLGRNRRRSYQLVSTAYGCYDFKTLKLFDWLSQHQLSLRSIYRYMLRSYSLSTRIVIHDDLEVVLGSQLGGAHVQGLS